MNEKKVLYEDEVKCPHCKKFIVVKRTKKTLVSPEKGEYEETTVIEKSKQKRLGGFGKKK